MSVANIKAFGTLQLRMQHPAWQRVWPELPANIEDQCWAVWEIWKKKPMSLSLLAKWIWAMHVLSVPSERKLWSNWRSKDSVQPDKERHPLQHKKEKKKDIRNASMTKYCTKHSIKLHGFAQKRLRVHSWSSQSMGFWLPRTSDSRCLKGASR